MFFRIVVLATFTAAGLSAQDVGKSFVIDASRPYVYLKFDHIGPRKPLSTDEVHTGLWLRIVNNCRVPISLGVFNTGTGDPGIGVFDETVPAGPVDGLMVLGPNARSQQPQPSKRNRPEGYSSEVFSTATIQPGEDLLFSVPLSHVSPSWHMQIRFKLSLPGGEHVSQPQTILPFHWEEIPMGVREKIGATVSSIEGGRVAQP